MTVVAFVLALVAIVVQLAAVVVIGRTALRFRAMLRPPAMSGNARTKEGRGAHV